MLDARFSPDGKQFLTGSVDGVARLWDTGSGRLLREFRGSARDNGFAIASPNGRYLVNGADLSFAFDDELTAESGPASIWDLESGRVYQWRIPQVLSASFSDDARLLAVGTKGRSVLVRDLATEEIVESLEGFAKPLNEVGLSPDASLLAAQDTSTLFRLWDMKGHREVLRQEKQGMGGGGFSFSKDGQLASSGKGANLTILKPAGDSQVFETRVGYKRSVTFAPDNHNLLIGGSTSVQPGAFLWSIDRGMQVRRFTMPQFTTSALSHDGKRAATGNKVGEVYLWNIDTGRKAGEL